VTLDCVAQTDDKGDGALKRQLMESTNFFNQADLSMQTDIANDMDLL